MNSTHRARRGVQTLRVTGFVVIACVMLASIGYESRDSFAQLRRDMATGGAVSASAEADNQYISVEVDVPAGRQSSSPAYELRLGVAYGDQVAYWREPARSTGSEPGSGGTIMTSRQAGEILVAIGPLHSPESSSGVISPNHASVVNIDGQPFVVVHRESVAGLLSPNGRAKKSVEFHQAQIGIRGAINLRHVG